jgi:hypothetical protein
MSAVVPELKYLLITTLCASEVVLNSRTQNKLTRSSESFFIGPPNQISQMDQQVVRKGRDVLFSRITKRGKTGSELVNSPEKPF